MKPYKVLKENNPGTKAFAQGPWSHEPNETEWEAYDLPCCIIRDSWSGHLCGYVGVPKGHPFYGKDYSLEILVFSETGTGYFLPKVGWCTSEYFSLPFSAHGGLTFAEKGKDNDFWWFGFDCAHKGDLQPKMVDANVIPLNPNDVYRDWNYVISETNALAKALSEVPQNYWESFVPTPQPVG